MSADALLEREILGAVAGDRLHLILLPTEACNFRCTYCYEDFKLGKMPEPVVRGVCNLLSRQMPQLDRLHLSWFGGEPLLALDVIETVQRHLDALCSEHPLDHRSADITTNAYNLTAERFRLLLELGVRRFQISFDGPRRWHDRKRLRADGSGTFDRIWANVVALRDEPGEFEITVRLHVDAENHGAAGEFIDDFQATLGSDPRFRLYVRALARLGGANDPALPVLPLADRAGVVSRLTAAAQEQQARTLEDDDLPSICYAARSNSYVVRSDGGLGKCTVALNHPANRVGQLHEDGTLRLDRRRVRPWMRGLYSLDAEELECPMHGLADPGQSPGATPPLRIALG